MKTLRNPVLLLFLFSLLLLDACKDEVVRTRTYHTTVPVYLSVATIRTQSVAVQAPQKLSAPGKIYIYGNYLFINETAKGIHVVDNSNPASPSFINFIDLPGNADMAVNSNILYADNYVDLLAFDINDPAHIVAVNRVDDVFDNQYIDKARGIILSYKDTVITEVVKEHLNSNKQLDLYYASASNSTALSYGTGGSTARFALMNNNLYTVDSYRLKLFNVSAPKIPQYLSSITLGWGIETIFPYQDKLFIGSTTGMHIYDASTPSAPKKLSTYQHFTSCDPVVVQGKYAYVTLRSGTTCARGTNLLDVLNIEDLSRPVLVSSFPMLNPHGLAISNTGLFICEGQNGLKAFDASDALQIGSRQVSFLTGLDANDVIAGPKSLIVTGSKGIYQYNYTDPRALKLLSHLTLTSNL